MVGMGTNPAYEDVSAWRKGNSSAEPWPRRTGSGSNPYHGTRELASSNLSPPPYSKENLTVVQNPAIAEPIYDRATFLEQGMDEYDPPVFVTGQLSESVLPVLRHGSPLDFETPLTTFVPGNQALTSAKPDEGIDPLLHPGAETDSIKFDVEENTAYAGRASWVDDAEVEMPQEHSGSGEYDSRGWLSSSMVANHLPPDLTSDMQGTITTGDSDTEQVPVTTPQQQDTEVILNTVLSSTVYWNVCFGNLITGLPIKSLCILYRKNQPP